MESQFDRHQPGILAQTGPPNPHRDLSSPLNAGRVVASSVHPTDPAESAVPDDRVSLMVLSEQAVPEERLSPCDGCLEPHCRVASFREAVSALCAFGRNLDAFAVLPEPLVPSTGQLSLCDFVVVVSEVPADPLLATNVEPEKAAKNQKRR